MKNKKYELTDETMDYNGVILHRIVAVKDFSDVKSGDLGGWVKSENNLSQEGDCWIYDEDTKVCSDLSFIHGNVKIRGYVIIKGIVSIAGNVEIHGNFINIHGNHIGIYDNVQILECVEICGNKIKIRENAKLCDDVKIDTPYTEIRGNATIAKPSDYLVFKNTCLNPWSSENYFTWTKSNNMWTADCFHGTGEQLIENAYRLEGKEIGDKYRAYVELVELVEKLNE